MNPCFAIIDANTLESMALKDMLWEIFDHVEVLCYNTLESFIKDSNRHFVHFFLSSPILFSNSEEFETLKDKTTVLTEGKDDNLVKTGFHTLDISASEETMMDRLRMLDRTWHQSKSEPLSGNEDEAVTRLSEREKQVLAYMVKGLINKEIAKELDISVTTVIFHRNNICEKLHTRSVGRLTVYAVLSGIVSIKEI